MHIYLAPGWFLVIRWRMIAWSMGRGNIGIVYPFGRGDERK